MSPSTFIETLVFFPVKLVHRTSNIVDENALPRIMANEATLANEANIAREEAMQDEKQQVEIQAQQDTVHY
ncbi:MAG TPA: hypothetical protein VIM42_02035 [Clostridium sp.]